MFPNLFRIFHLLMLISVKWPGVGRANSALKPNSEHRAPGPPQCVGATSCSQGHQR